MDFRLHNLYFTR